MCEFLKIEIFVQKMNGQCALVINRCNINKIQVASVPPESMLVKPVLFELICKLV